MPTRRNFLQALGAFMVAHKLPAPIRWQDHWREADPVFKAPEPKPEHPEYTTYIVGKDALVGSYADYMTVTTLALSPVINAKLNSVGYRIDLKALPLPFRKEDLDDAG